MFCISIYCDTVQYVNKLSPSAPVLSVEAWMSSEIHLKTKIKRCKFYGMVLNSNMCSLQIKKFKC